MSGRRSPFDKLHVHLCWATCTLGIECDFPVVGTHNIDAIVFFPRGSSEERPFPPLHDAARGGTADMLVR